jgi:hypothetical protein
MLKIVKNELNETKKFIEEEEGLGMEEEPSRREEPKIGIVFLFSFIFFLFFLRKTIYG